MNREQRRLERKDRVVRKRLMAAKQQRFRQTKGKPWKPTYGHISIGGVNGALADRCGQELPQHAPMIDANMQGVTA